MADETFVIVEVKCGNCKTKFGVEQWESDDDTVVLECPGCKYLVHWDGTIFAEVV
jgi:DNA-directed RNA polymerase subunit RPC12/RpoP